MRSVLKGHARCGDLSSVCWETTTATGRPAPAPTLTPARDLQITIEYSAFGSASEFGFATFASQRWFFRVMEGMVSVWFFCYDRSTSLSCEWLAVISRTRLAITDGHADVDNVDPMNPVSCKSDEVRNLPPGQSISISTCRFVNCKGCDSGEHGQATIWGIDDGLVKCKFDFSSLGESGLEHNQTSTEVEGEWDCYLWGHDGHDRGVWLIPLLHVHVHEEFIADTSIGNYNFFMMMLQASSHVALKLWSVPPTRILAGRENLLRVIQPFAFEFGILRNVPNTNVPEYHLALMMWRVEILQRSSTFITRGNNVIVVWYAPTARVID